MVANPSLTTNDTTVTQASVAVPQQRLYLFLLVYRWGSLLLAMWLFLAATDVVVAGISLGFLLALSLVGTLLITIFLVSFRRTLLETPLLLGLDLGFVSILLALSGNVLSPYNLYALSPLLVSAFFFQMRGAVFTVAAFSVIYPFTLLLAQQIGYPVAVDISNLFTQLAGAWLVSMLFGSLSNLVKQLQQAHEALAKTHTDLAQQNQELAATHHQLEVIHELTLFLHTPDQQSVQQRLLKAVTKELGFARAVIGLINPTLHRIEKWQAQPAEPDTIALAAPIPLIAEDGVIAQTLLEQQVHWSSTEKTLTMNDTLADWLAPDHWLILPLTWQSQPVGVLLVSVEAVSGADFTEDRWAILTSLVSQAAVALGTIDRTRSLAVEQERNRIARDIHDTVAQSLFGIVFSLDACTKMLPAQVEVVREELVELRNVADQVRREVRQSILNIWPSALTSTQFKADLGKYVADCAPAHVFHLDFSIDGDFDALPAVIRRSLYRVCQEALANAARHAGVDAARIYLYVEPDEVHLSIRDKGRGFDPKVVLARERSRERFGLRGMRERIETLGGTCDILSQGSQGTQVLVRVPINGRSGHG